MQTHYPVQGLWTIYTKSFIDNTEYFNKITEGQTLFGFHFSPILTCLLAETLALDIGFIWHKKFGQIKPWDGIRPLLSTYYTHKHATVAVGIMNLPPALSTLLEPLFDPNRSLQRPYMEGFHFRIGHPKMYVAAWLDWYTLLSKKKQRPEKFTVHLDAAYQNSNQTNRWKIPLQLTIYHQGGQGIPIKSYSLFCGAMGLSLTFLLACRCLKQMHIAGYLCFNSYSKAIDRPFKNGWGQLYTMDWTLASIRFACSYWRGTNFSSENIGNPLYQSVRVEDDKVVHYEAIRNLLFLSIRKEWLLHPAVTIQASFRPYYDCKNQLLEYSLACTIAYCINGKVDNGGPPNIGTG